MVVLLVVLTFAAFIAADYFLNREKYRIPVDDNEQEPSQLAGKRLPAELFFHPGHTWVMREGSDVVRVGLDEFAVRALEHPANFRVPLIARWVRQGETAFRFGEDGHEVEFVSPVEGEVIEVNRAMLLNPALVKEDPYGNGWLVRLRSPDLATSLRNLLSGGLAVKWMEESAALLRDFFAQQQGGRAHAVSGGPVPGSLDEQAWRRLRAQFFRT